MSSWAGSIAPGLHCSDGYAADRPVSDRLCVTRQSAAGPPPVFFAGRFAAFLAVVFAVFLAVFLAVFFAGRLPGVAGPLARRSARSSAARSMVISSTESPLRKLAFDSPSVT